ncbi:hypothetical protein [Paracoccus sediminicola]|uniref:hypothetical protein n=1 Tax=Paracoccus sediminicola TaxID=3017783 RepID=UPI0022F119AE|nr:hypothetical protein [Paracoccus sediminicola]WBU56564.1 hypothetical protein PAF18_13970 [Paracoccus sediminicola]
MTLQEIKAAVDAGHRVHWANPGYRVTRDQLGQYLILYTRTGDAIGLTDQTGTLLNGAPDEFFIGETAEEAAQ